MPLPLTAAVYAGDDLDDLELIGASTPRTPGGRFSFAAEAGTRYWVSVGWPKRDPAAFMRPIAMASLHWGETPENDEPGGATALSSTRGGTRASNRYATTASREFKDGRGNSSLWWTWEAPASGWYRFYVTDRTGMALTVYEGDDYSRPLSRSGWVRGDSEATFHAVAGHRYTIRVGTLGETSGGGFALRWEVADERAWLRYADAQAEAVDPLGNPLHPTTSAGSLSTTGAARCLPRLRWGCRCSGGIR